MVVRRLCLFSLAFLIITACAIAPETTNNYPRVPWYQRTQSEIPGFVRHEDVVDGRTRRFGCLFTTSPVPEGIDALMCFEPETRHAAIWLVGLRPGHCNVQGCVVSLEGDDKEALGTRLSLEVVPAAKELYGLYVKGSTVLYDMAYDAGNDYTLHVFTEGGGMRSFDFSVPAPYRH